jgi:malonyl-CoA O-methyltransferase
MRRAPARLVEPGMSAFDHMRSVHARFNRAAATYTAAARVQAEAAARLLRAMELVGDEPVRILDAGCGTGLLTRLLVRRFPAARVDAFDISERMLDAAQAHTPSDRPVRWIHADFQHFEAALPYSLVASASALHWATDFRHATGKLAACLAPGGWMAVSIMLDGTLRELHACRERIVPDVAAPAPMPSPATLREALSDAGLRMESEGAYELVADYSDARAALRDLHTMGLTGGVRIRPGRLLTRGELWALERLYEDTFRTPDGRIPTTYCVGWALARRAG